MGYDLTPRDGKCKCGRPAVHRGICAWRLKRFEQAKEDGV